MNIFMGHMTCDMVDLIYFNSEFDMPQSRKSENTVYYYCYSLISAPAAHLRLFLIFEHTRGPLRDV